MLVRKGRRAFGGGRGWAAAVTGLLVAATAMVAVPGAGAVTQPSGNARATVETAPVLNTGDSADDPAIWAHPTDPAKSVVIGNDKKGALEVYDLSGARIQRIAEGYFGNVDVRKGFVSGAGPIDVVVTYRLGIRIYKIDPVTRLLTNATDSASGSIAAGFAGEGMCLYRSPISGGLSVFANARSGQMAQFTLNDSDGDGLVEALKVRDWDVGTEVEGCVADDELGHLYVSEESVGIWKYNAEPTGATTPDARVLVDGTTGTGGHLVPDVEGLTIVYQPDGTGYLLASSQAASNTLNSYAAYERQGANAFLRSFKVENGPAVDGCGRTDGIDALAADLGPTFPNGVFVCQDNNNSTPASGNQNFKLVPLERVVALSSAPVPNRQPGASLSAQCSGLTCTVSGAASSDPDGTVVSHGWDFGDGTTGTGAALSHDYLSPGSYTITLTVTDDDGATGQATRTVIVAVPTSAAITFVGQATSNLNATSHTVRVPAGVAAGDGLLLFFGSNTSAATSEPAGWSPLDTLAGPSSVTRVWRKVAGAAEAGALIRVDVPSISKANLVVVAYRGTSGVDPVAAFAKASESTSRTTHVTPSAAVNASGSWAVSYWTHRDSSTTALTPPEGVSVRASSTQTGAGRVTALVADSGAPVPVGSYGGLTATATTAGINATMWTIVLAPNP